MAPDCRVRNDCYCLASRRLFGHCCRVSTPSPPVPPAPDSEDLRGLARGMRHLLELAAQTLSAEAGPSGLALRVTGHLGCELAELVLVSARFPSWEQVNVQRGVDAYLAAHAAGAQWFGPAGGGHRPHEDMLSLLSMPPHAVMGWAGSRGSARAVVRGGAGRGGDAVGAASYGTAAVGPEENTEVVSLGLVAAAAPAGAPVVIGIRDESRFGPPLCTLEVLAAGREAATTTRDEIERLMRAHDVFRGQVLSFTESEHHGNELVTFLPRPAVTASDVVLPDGVLEHIERHIIGIADWSAELLGAGQHLKRGLLLHGPPGTGKTHTVRYLTSRLASLTVILLTGRSIRFIDQAAALARRLQPSIVVLEDVDPGRRRPRLHPRRESAAVLAAGGDGRGRRGRGRHVRADHQPGRHPGNRARGPARPGGPGGRAPPAGRALPGAATARVRQGPDRGRRPRPGGGGHRGSHRLLHQGDDQADRAGIAAGRRAPAGAARPALRRRAGRDELRAPGAHPLAARRR